MEGSEGAATSAASACSLVISVQAGFSGQGQAGPAGSPPSRAWCSQGRLPLCWEDRHLAPSVPRLPLPCPRPQEATAPAGSLSVRHHCFPILASCSAWCLPQGAWSRRPRSASEEPVQGSWRGGRLCNCEVCVCGRSFPRWPRVVTSPGHRRGLGEAGCGEMGRGAETRLHSLLQVGLGTWCSTALPCCPSAIPAPMWGLRPGCRATHVPCCGKGVLGCEPQPCSGSSRARSGAPRPQGSCGQGSSGHCTYAAAPLTGWKRWP